MLFDAWKIAEERRKTTNQNKSWPTSLRRAVVSYYGEAHTHVGELEEVASEGGISHGASVSVRLAAAVLKGGKGSNLT